MKVQPISFLSGLLIAITVPVINAASLSWNPGKIAKDNGIVVLAEQTAKHASKARMNVDSNGVILKGDDPVAYFSRHQAVKGNPAIQLYVYSDADGAKEFRSSIDENIRQADENWLPPGRAQGQPYNRGPR